MRTPLKLIAPSGATQGQAPIFNATSGAWEAGDVNQAGGFANNNRNMTASATTADGQVATATGLAIDLSAWVAVLVDGRGVNVGDGVKTVDCYFSADGGTTARAFGELQSGDLLYWNGSVAGYQLATTDRIDFLFDLENGTGSGGGGGSGLPPGTEGDVLMYLSGAWVGTPAGNVLPTSSVNNILLPNGSGGWISGTSMAGWPIVDSSSSFGPAALSLVSQTTQLALDSGVIADVTLASTPTITDGGDIGSQLTVYSALDNLYNITLQSEDTLPGSRIELVGGGTVTLAPGDAVQFAFHVGRGWVEIYRLLA
jgi:hypothetical protein